jgi:hypothetical protein
MPISYTAQQVTAIQSGKLAPVVLADIVTVDGSQYFYSDGMTGPFLKADATGSVAYVPMLQAIGALRCSRDAQTDAGDITFQNVSGNLIRRDFSDVAASRELEGALCVVRFWDSLFDFTIDSFHGYLSEQDIDEQFATFRLLQLLDGGMYELANDTYSELCTLRYKGGICQSPSGNPVCNKRFTDCNLNAAVEHFNGIPIMPPNPVYANRIGYDSSNRGGDSGDWSNHGPVNRIEQPTPLN